MRIVIQETGPEDAGKAASTPTLWKFKELMEEGDATARFILLDDPEEIGPGRCDYLEVCNLRFPPVRRFNRNELILA